MRLWLKWSLRDLRARWIQVSAIAFIIAIGTGLYAGLSSTSEWRRVSYDASYARLHMYDLHGALSTGSYVDSGELLAVARGIPSADQIRAAEARLVLPTQVDASSRGKTILVPGRLVGVDVSGGGPHVNAVSAESGRAFRPDDAGLDRAILDEHFANHYDLPDRGRIAVSGGVHLDYIATGLSPEYFMITGERGIPRAEANYAVVFTSIETTQRIAGRPGMANDLVLALRPGADLRTVQQQLDRAFATSLPGVGVSFNRRGGDLAYRTLYDDIDGDQRFYNIFAVLILAGAAFAAFNLTGRIVEAQRREIGIGMALGVPRRELAIRPMLVGAEIALLGVVFGLVIGIGAGNYMGSVTKGLIPLPVWHFPFQLGVFLRAAALGFAIPFLATAYPVWRAVRVPPVEAIRTGYLSAKSGGLAPLLAAVPIPGRTTTQMPFRNVLRAPRRTVMTLLGIAAAITVLIGVVGIVDSFLATIDRADTELSKSSPDRATVQMDSFYPTSASQVAAVERSPAVGASNPILQLPGTIERGDKKVSTFLDLTDLRSGIWHPTIKDQVHANGPGIVVSETAARALGVRPGDTVTLRHPRRDGPASYQYVRTKIPVVGLNPLPLRAVAFMDIRDASMMNLAGVTNSVVVDPARGVSRGGLERALFGQSGVASVQPISAYTDTIRDELGAALGILAVVEVAVLLLALLIAFNSASINADERAREEATMFAFGLRVPAVLRIATTESLVIGALGTGVGLALGWLLLDWIVTGLIPQTFPDIGVITAVSGRTWLTAVLLGVLAVTLAPLFTTRKLHRMDIPSTLRVME